MERNLGRNRQDLAEFLRSRRERISPAEAGLTATGRRRTPGLRREEVAALAGVGLSWYTWLEQGRDIGVSPAFLDNLCRVLKLDAMERRHLYLLSHQRPPAEQGKTWCVVPKIVNRLLADLPLRPAYVLNLRWDVLAWNPAADKIFKFSDKSSEHRNILWMLFSDEHMRSLFCPWDDQAIQMLSSFRRDYVHASKESDVVSLVHELEKTSPEFKSWWSRQDIHGPCQGIRHLLIESFGNVTLEHTTLTIDVDRHLRLVYYAPIDQGADVLDFEEWLQGRGREKFNMLEEGDGFKACQRIFEV
ncbi:helix-turn-helix transcriptional regulator [Pseudomonas asplenii]|uniref:helix-turn-helix transcriptional regulator n=1 Tax=Pseudomonas asplenii TaxID=53407 RepID=UPI002233FBF3|nr:helix-turn-helix transcriptional regulator [Pseudomonas asplenii]UZE29993.1 helix-turn-helix transcriptional regulator [Pseudomonas asplenii]